MGSFTQVRTTLKKVFPDAEVQRLAKESGFVVRERKVKPVPFFWTLLLGFGTADGRSISSLRRSFSRSTGETLVPSAFYDRFNTKLVRMLKAAVVKALESFQLATGGLTEMASIFHDVFLTDGTVLKLLPGLKGIFPGTRTNSAPAAAKVHALISVKGKGKSTVGVTGERASELKKLKVGPWVRGSLLLFDLGYFCYPLFARICDNDGYFVSRLKEKANPLIVRVHRVVRGNSIALEGCRLQDVLGRLQRETLDVEVEVEFKRRRYGGKSRGDRARYRLVAVRNVHTETYHCFLTNVPPDMLSAEQISGVYRARWAIELLFKELKSGYRMDQFTSEKREVVEALIYAAILSLVASRRLFGELTRREPTGRATVGRWWRLFQSYAQDLLLIVVRPLKDVGALRYLVRTLLHEVVDPHTDRRPLLQDSLVGYAGYARG